MHPTFIVESMQHDAYDSCLPILEEHLRLESIMTHTITPEIRLWEKISSVRMSMRVRESL